MIFAWVVGIARDTLLWQPHQQCQIQNSTVAEVCELVCMTVFDQSANYCFSWYFEKYKNTSKTVISSIFRLFFLYFVLTLWIRIKCARLWILTIFSHWHKFRHHKINQRKIWNAAHVNGKWLIKKTNGSHWSGTRLVLFWIHLVWVWIHAFPTLFFHLFTQGFFHIFIQIYIKKSPKQFTTKNHHQHYQDMFFFS